VVSARTNALSPESRTVLHLPAQQRRQVQRASGHNRSRRCNCGPGNYLGKESRSPDERS